MRKTLSLKNADGAAPAAAATPASGIIEAAIVRRMCIHATYNRTDMKIAPHILYTRHDDPFVDGVVIERSGKPPREVKLASFKLAGLSALTLSTDRFELQKVFDPAEPRYVDCTLTQVKLAEAATE